MKQHIWLNLIVMCNKSLAVLAASTPSERCSSCTCSLKGPVDSITNAEAISAMLVEWLVPEVEKMSCMITDTSVLDRMDSSRE